LGNGRLTKVREEEKAGNVMPSRKLLFGEKKRAKGREEESK
jgi:hypothetical protein